MSLQNQIEIQDCIVKTIAESIGRNWDFAVVNIEIDEIEGEQTENCLALSFVRQRDVWERSSFQLPYECYDLFVMLRNSKDQEKWKTCTVEFDGNGKYKFSYSYDAPRRLNGIHDDEAMLKGYSPFSFVNRECRA